MKSIYFKEALAHQAYLAYGFGDGVLVTGASAWDYSSHCDDLMRNVHIETPAEDDGPAPRWTLIFTARFDPTTGVLTEAKAVDRRGGVWGSLPKDHLGKQFLISQWFHCFGEELSASRCRITIDLISMALVAAQEWNGFEFQDINGDRFSALSESVVSHVQISRNFDNVFADPEYSDSMPEWASQKTGPANYPFVVIGAHENENFFEIRVSAEDPLKAFGAAALMLKEAGEEGEAKFFVALPANSSFELPGDSVVSMDTVLDPEGSDVFGIEPCISEHVSMRLTIDVICSLNGVGVDELINCLQNLCEKSIDDGLLTGETDADVDQYSLSVEIKNSRGLANDSNQNSAVASLNLNIEVTYSLNGENPIEMAGCVRKMLHSAIGDGMLSCDSAAEVNLNSVEVEITSEIDGTLPANLDPRFKAQIRDLQNVTRVLNSATLM